MFELFLRKTVFRNVVPEDQNVPMLFKYQYKAKIIASYLLIFIFAFPVTFMALSLLYYWKFFSIVDIVSLFILIVAYLIFLVWFGISFFYQIKHFKNLMYRVLYCTQYLFKGHAISKTDFDNIAKQDRDLHNRIITLSAQGHCYPLSFRLLKCLRKGYLLFIAVNSVRLVNEDEPKNKYAMHVLYVYDDWCYDTYSQMQYPLAYVLKQFEAVIYRTYTLDDIEGKTYDQFRSEECGALKLWCAENDCEEGWSDFSKG